jgi:putative transposase
LPSLEEENRELRRENARLKEEREILRTATACLAKDAMKFAFIQAHATTARVTTMCRVLAVSRAGYFKWRAEPFGLRKQGDAKLLVHVRQKFYRLRRRYGSPRLCHELRAAGHRCSVKRGARLMRLAGLRAKGAHRFVVTTDAAHA